MGRKERSEEEQFKKDMLRLVIFKCKSFLEVRKKNEGAVVNVRVERYDLRRMNKEIATKQLCSLYS